tara:strand:- start:246 stop:563 length:318 start_codon:yes stop_codon:yes gene_type:complete
MKGGSPAYRLVMGGVKTSNAACNDRFQAAHNTHDLSGSQFHLTTGGGKKKGQRKGKKSRKSRKGKKSQSSRVMSRSKNRYILYGKHGSKKKCGGKNNNKNNMVTI